MTWFLTYSELLPVNCLKVAFVSSESGCVRCKPTESDGSRGTCAMGVSSPAPGRAQTAMPCGPERVTCLSCYPMAGHARDTSGWKSGEAGFVHPWYSNKGRQGLPAPSCASAVLAAPASEQTQRTKTGSKRQYARRLRHQFVLSPGVDGTTPTI